MQFWSKNVTQAEEINWKAYRVEGRGALTENEFLDVAAWVEQIWEEQLPFGLRLRHYETVTEHKCHMSAVLEQFRNQCTWDCWYQESFKRGWRKMNSIAFVVLPPLIEQGWKMSAGMAFMSMYKSDFVEPLAIGMCSQWSSHTPAKLRDFGCVIVLIHELLHSIGATHTEDKSFMNAAAGQFVDSDYGTLRMSEETVNQAVHFLDRTNRLLIRQLRKEYNEKLQKGKFEAAAKLRSILRYRSKHWFRKNNGRD
jgi:hypothetical protein